MCSLSLARNSRECKEAIERWGKKGFFVIVACRLTMRFLVVHFFVSRIAVETRKLATVDCVTAREEKKKKVDLRLWDSLECQLICRRRNQSRRDVIEIEAEREKLYFFGNFLVVVNGREGDKIRCQLKFLRFQLVKSSSLFQLWTWDLKIFGVRERESENILCEK